MPSRDSAPLSPPNPPPSQTQQPSKPPPQPSRRKRGPRPPSPSTTARATLIDQILRESNHTPHYTSNPSSHPSTSNTKSSTATLDPDAAAAEAFDNWGEELLLIDAAVPGSGEAWDYGSVRAKALAGRKWLLAGGLDPANVARAAAEAGAWGVDVSSGVESARGIKDLAKIGDFVRATKGSE